MRRPTIIGLRNTLIRTLLVALSLAMGVVLVRIYDIKQEVDEVGNRLTLEFGPQTTLIYDSKDRVISALFKEHRMPVILEQISEPLQQAVLAAEDQRFYEHNGVDLRRMTAAMVANVRRGRIVQGASTITQQFVRANVLDRSRTYGRKFREAWLSHRLEEKFGKRAILQAYLNHVYFGEGYYGVEAASLGYFGKHAADITAVEGATLASLINRPSGWTIRKTPTRIRDRRDWVLREMYAAGYIDADTFGTSIATPVLATLASDQLRAEMDPAVAYTGPYFASLVHETLFEQFGVDRALTGGLRVYTTLDSDVQKFAEDSVTKRLNELDKKKQQQGAPLQAALVAIENSTGYVRALVGGRNFAESPFNRATAVQAPARLRLQAVRLRGRARSRLLTRHDDRRPRWLCRFRPGRVPARRRARDRVDDAAIRARAFEQPRRGPPAAACWPRRHDRYGEPHGSRRHALGAVARAWHR